MIWHILKMLKNQGKKHDDCDNWDDKLHSKAGWHNLRLVLTSRFDQKCFPQTVFREIFVRLAKKNADNGFFRQNIVFLHSSNKILCFKSTEE